MLIAWVLVTGPALARDAYLNDASTEGDVPLPGCPVMPEGRDQIGCGSCDLPCRTPSYLLTQLGYLLQLGDTIHLNTGRYHARAADEAIVTFSGDWSFVTLDGEWVTLTGPVDVAGRALRDASGMPLAVLDGRGTAPAGVVVMGSGVRLRALRIENLAEAPPPLCGSAVHVMRDRTVSAYAFEQLDIAGVTSSIGSAIEVEQPNSTCRACTIVDNRIHASPPRSPAIWIESQHNVRIAGNHITGWGEGPNASGIRAVGDGIEILHNVIQNSAGPAIEAQGKMRIAHNTFRSNARVPATTDSPKGLEVLLAGAGGITLDHNILAPLPERAAVGVETLSDLHTFNFNGYALEGAFAGYTAVDARLYRTLVDWQEVTRQEANAREGQAHFASDADAHLRSQTGRWDGQGWVADAETSPFIDAGDPFRMQGEAPFLHGGVPNLGAYGNTPEASLSIARLVKLGGSDVQGEVGQPLSTPFRVEVRGFDRFGDLHPSHPDVPVGFRVVSGAADLSETRVVTDDQGRARVDITPREAGVLHLEAFVDGVPGITPVLFEASISGDPDGGTPGPEPAPGRAHYTVGFGCGQATGPAFPLALLTWLTLRWRRRRAG